MQLHRSPRCGPLAAIFAVALPGLARAQELRTPATSHPIYVSAEGAALDDAARDRFRQAASKLRLGPVETVDLPPLPEPKAPSTLAAGAAFVRDQAFDQARPLLLEAVAEVNDSGGAGLNQDALCDLFLHLAMAFDRADWRELPEQGPPTANPEADAAYLQSAVLCPQRQLYQRGYGPLARHRFEQAQAKARARGQGVLEVKAPLDALISVDGRPLAASPVQLTLPYGDHFIRVERPGRLPWASRVPLTLNQLSVEPGTQTFRSFPDADAAQHARRMAAAYALVAELKPGPEALLELRLVEVASGQRLDSTRVPLQGDVGGVHAAVMRLDEQARKRVMQNAAGAQGLATNPALQIGVVPVRARDASLPGPTQDPQGWARQHWPVLTAVGVVLLTSIVLGVVVALEDKSAVQ